MFDLNDIKFRAQGNWQSILSSVGGVDASRLDGKHGPCPKCGGNDRFRMIDQKNGSLFCNHCFNSKNGDGIAAIQWLLDCDFKSALSKIADYLGIKPTERQSKSKKTDPANHLEFKEWNPMLAGLWCLKKKPINPESLEKVGARMAIYRSRFKVIALPVWREDPANVVGWCIFSIDGGKLPKFTPTGEIDHVKVKLTYGSKPGVIGWLADDSTRVYKTEGPTDLLALVQILGESDSAICNANGAKENPAKWFGWIAEKINGKEIRVIHDADEPGQSGATFVESSAGDRRAGWAPWLAAQCPASVVRNVQLPYEIETTHGKDIRDWIVDGGTADLLDELAEVDPVAAAEAEELDDIFEADDDPHRLARLNLKNYKRITGGCLKFHNEEWWKYKSGVYSKIGFGELRAKVADMIHKEFIACWKAKDPEQRAEKPVQKVTIGLVSNVIAAMASQVAIPSSVSMPCWLPDRSRRNYISAKNGIIDFDSIFAGRTEEECLLSHSPDWFSSFRLNYEFDAGADCPKWLQYLDEVMENDDDRISLLQEWAGYCLTQVNEFQKFIVLEGEGKNGKTVYFAGISAMLGEENISHVSIENFGGRFDLGVTLGKAANICGDVGEIDHLAEGILKQFTGGDTMQFDRKNLQPVQARPTAKLMAAWNQRPRIKDRSSGLWRRMLLVPFRYEIPEEKRIYGMDQPEYWHDEAPGILLWAIAGLHRLRKQRGFTVCEISKAAMQEYRSESNPTTLFLRDAVTESQGDFVNCLSLFEEYRKWCGESNSHPLGMRQFGKEIKKLFPTADRVRVRIQGKRFYVYMNVRHLTDDEWVKIENSATSFV